MAETSPLPPGSYVELNLDLIDEGNFRRKVESKVREMYQRLIKYEQETGDLTARAKLTIKIGLQRAKGTTKLIELKYGTKLDTPEGQSVTLAKEGLDGHLICQPAGTDEGDPDQQKFYDANGRLLGAVEGDHIIPPNQIAKDDKKK